MLLDLGVDHLVDRPQIDRDLADLLGDPSEEVHVGGICRGVADGNEVEHLRVLGLAIAVDAADALFEARRVPRDVEVHQAVAVRLQVDALTRGVRGDEHANLLVVGIGGEPQPDQLALVGVGGALDHGEPRAVASGGENVHDPLDGVGVLGEHHDPLVRPFPAGATDAVEEPDQRLEAGIGFGLV